MPTSRQASPPAETQRAQPPTVTEVLATQDRVIARPQALAAGMSKDAWSHRLSSGRWTALCNGVAAAHSGAPQGRELDWAAVLHGGKDAALSGDAALVFFGAKRLTIAKRDIAIPSERRVQGVTSELLVVEPHRLRGLGRWVGSHPHLRLVHVHAATLHAAAWAGTDEEAEHRLTLVVQQRLTSPLVLRTSLRQMPRLPRHALIAEVLDDIEHGATAQSELEFVRFCRQHGLPPPDEMQLKVRTGTTRYLDAYYRERRIIVEVDGAHHQWAAQWEADAMRSLQLAVAMRDTGARIIRAMMRHHAEQTAALLHQLLVG